MTLEINAQLLKCACEMSGINDKTTVVNAALTALVQREAARFLASQGGLMPNIGALPRRRRGWASPRKNRTR
ncbi:MAG: type II toxin-antitoxin system VapB family antitoxin [Phycisphaerales bacterium]|nr:type II toxin-antitoxin system VapB family antitoxin [Phycisphaerales bacterium]